LKGFYPKSSRASFFVKTNLSNVYLSATIFYATFYISA